MALYHVYAYREMRLCFPAIEADSPEEAADLARDLPISEASGPPEDCDGDTSACHVGMDASNHRWLVEFWEGDVEVTDSKSPTDER